MTYQEFDTARLAYRKKLVIFYIILAALIIIPIILGLPYGVEGIFNAISYTPIIAITFVICRFFILGKTHATYQKCYKAYFVTESLMRLIPGCRYAHDRGISDYSVAETGLFDLGNTFSSNDLITGEYKGVDFSQADVEITEKHTDSDGHTYTVTTFQGRYMIFEFKKKFDFRLAVIGRRFTATDLRRRKDGRKFSRITLESPMFNKLYKVYAEDGFEAFYLLDPAFLERAEYLAKAHKKRVFLGFFENKLHVAIQDGKDSLEPPSPFHKLDEAAEFAKVGADLKIITDIVDNLKLS